jgi:hypothetical protein
MWLFIVPGAIFLAAGIVLALTLSTGTIKIPGGPALDLNSFIVACFLTILGTQAIGFGIMARRYAAVMGILPMGPRSRWLRNFATTDNVVLFAVLLFVAGTVIFLGAFRAWAIVKFGNLETHYAPRAVIAGFSLIVIAVQTLFQAFIIGLMDIPVFPKTTDEPLVSDAD